MTDLAVQSKKQIFQRIAQEIEALSNCEPELVLNSFLEREKIGPTAIGNGIAIPHVRLPKLDRMIAILARLNTPIDFDAHDGQPVDLIFALVAPEESKNNSHLKSLGRISRFLRDAQNCAQLRQCLSQEHVISVIDQWSAEVAA